MRHSEEMFLFTSNSQELYVLCTELNLSILECQTCLLSVIFFNTEKADKAFMRDGEKDIYLKLKAIMKAQFIITDKE